jgi:hypothetical protein
MEIIPADKAEYISSNNRKGTNNFSIEKSKMQN